MQPSSSCLRMACYAQQVLLSTENKRSSNVTNILQILTFEPFSFQETASLCRASKTAWHHVYGHKTYSSVAISYS